MDECCHNCLKKLLAFASNDSDEWTQDNQIDEIMEI